MSTQAISRPHTPRHWLHLGLFLVVVIGVGSILGILNAPGAWYEALEKPPFNPPNWIFGPVWTTLYVLIAIAGWRTFERNCNGTAMKLWAGQMVINWLWTPVFFAAQALWPAVVVLLAMLACIVGFMIVSAREGDRTSAWLFAPYLAWVSFAGLLNLSLAILN